jgi:hypothetical protein
MGSLPDDKRSPDSAAVAALPSIFVNSIPKSGTVFSGLALTRGLGLEPSSFSSGQFPYHLVDVAALARFAKGGCCAQGHVDASAVNLQSLGAFLTRWVVHIRDPRSVLLSWVHHISRIFEARSNGQYEHLLIFPAPPNEYYERPFGERIDWNIDNFLPAVVRWTRDWLAVCDSGEHNILLTTYSELVLSERAFIDRILAFYGIERSRLSWPEIPRTMSDSHFRTGTEDEWLSVLSQDQLARSTAAIGKDLLERFNWPVPPGVAFKRVSRIARKDAAPNPKNIEKTRIARTRQLEARLEEERLLFRDELSRREAILAQERDAFRTRIFELLGILNGERQAFTDRIGDLETTLAAERSAFVSRISDLETTLAAERAAFTKRIVDLEAALGAERQAFTKRIAELEANLSLEKNAPPAHLSEVGV